MKDVSREQVAWWVEKQLDGALSTEEFDRVQQVLMEQPDARELYLDLMHQNALLQLERGYLAATGPVATQTLAEQRREQPTAIRKAVFQTAIGILAASILLILWISIKSDDATLKAPVIARITDSADATWGDCTLPTAVGSGLQAGRLKIDRGLVTITFSSGAELILESPAELEILSPLSGRLLAGTAVVEVPDTAHGFRLATPTAVAVDYGTAFAVTVDAQSQTSSIEVHDGEVKVTHVASGASRSLKGEQRVLASLTQLSDAASSTGEATLVSMQQSGNESGEMLRITTAEGRGQDFTVCRSHDDDVLKNSHAGLVLVKNPYQGYERFSRKGYFLFDMASLAGRKVTSARFVLTLAPSGLGFASKVDDCEFTVYGLTDESAEGWPAGPLDWHQAPANLDGAADVDTTQARLLGRFVVRRGVQHGQVSIGGRELTRFLRSDTNQQVSLIVVRETKESEPGGLVHGLANGTSTDLTPPTLIVHTDSQ
ncbi:MAG: FecR family protein [Planctomycetota bacterium]